VVQRSSDNAIGVRRLGFGVSGPHGTPMVNARTTAQLIERAFERGVRLFDTGPSYGNGEAERRLGETLKRLPRWECIISTKAGINDAGFGQKSRDFSPDGVRRSVHASIKRMGLQRLDWLLLHGPAPHELTDELLKALVDLKFNGDVAALGVVGRGDELDHALATGQFTVFMAPVNAALPTEDLERLNRIKASGSELVGFNTLVPALKRYPIPLTPGSTWRLARSIFGMAGPAPPTPMTVEECLHWALFEAVAHRVVVTSSSLAHLETNVGAVEIMRSGRMITSAPSPALDQRPIRP
jgi:aryl-alcohol dehydrogenase-like predicted oxidoreductase